jgi:hypothetical protein
VLENLIMVRRMKEEVFGRAGEAGALPPKLREYVKVSPPSLPPSLLLFSSKVS